MKPALIFVHGFRGSHIGLEDIAKEFSDYQVFAPDIPPFGDSSSLKAYDKDSYADFIANFIREHKLKKPILVGHSMGSIIVAATAEKYPELINEKLVLLAPISAKPARFFAKIQPLAVILPGKVVDYITTRYLFVPHNRKLFSETIKITGECSKKYISKAEVMAACHFSTDNEIGDFNIKKKVLLLGGEKDRLIPRKKTETLGKTLGAKTKFVAGAGHLLNYEKPRETAKIIRDFIEN